MCSAIYRNVYTQVIKERLDRPINERKERGISRVGERMSKTLDVEVFLNGTPSFPMVKQQVLASRVVGFLKVLRG